MLSFSQIARVRHSKILFLQVHHIRYIRHPASVVLHPAKRRDLLQEPVRGIKDEWKL